MAVVPTIQRFTIRYPEEITEAPDGEWMRAADVGAIFEPDVAYMPVPSDDLAELLGLARKYVELVADGDYYVPGEGHDVPAAALLARIDAAMPENAALVKAEQAEGRARMEAENARRAARPPQKPMRRRGQTDEEWAWIEQLYEADLAKFRQEHPS